MKPPWFTALICLAGLALPSGLPAETPQANPKTLEVITETIQSLAKDPTGLTGTVGVYLAPLDRAAQPLLKHYARQSFIARGAPGKGAGLP